MSFKHSKYSIVPDSVNYASHINGIVFGLKMSEHIVGFVVFQIQFYEGDFHHYGAIGHGNVRLGMLINHNNHILSCMYASPTTTICFCQVIAIAEHSAQ